MNGDIGPAQDGDRVRYKDGCEYEVLAHTYDDRPIIGIVAGSVPYHQQIVSDNDLTLIGRKQ